MGNQVKNKNSHHQSSGFKEHQQVGKKLHPPLAQLPVKTVQWSIDMLPEMFLIDAVVNQLTWNQAPDVLHAIFDILDPFVPAHSKEILTGTISTIKLIPEASRDNARSALIDADLLPVLLPEGLRCGLALYPNCPAAWLLADWHKDHKVDWEKGIHYLKGAVRRLWNSKGVYSTRCRMFPLARMMKHGKIFFMQTLEIDQLTDLLPLYPNKLTEDEQRHVEASSRAMFNAIYNLARDGKVDDWVPSFWRHNYEISMCEQPNDAGGKLIEEHELRPILEGMKAPLRHLSQVVQRATRQAKLDLYDVDKDEVLFGLLGRQYRLFQAIATNPTLWTADLGTMFHRVMVDTLITLKWLIHQNDPALFYQFKQFSLGKLKLLKLHIHDLVNQGRENLATSEEDLSEEINEEKWEALLSIDLGGNFAGMDMRKMAHEVDLREIYNLVYSPASSELHGEWTSLKRFNLVRCRNPLHRFHRLPQLSSETFLFPEAVLRAGSILAETLTVWITAYQLQSLSDEFKDFVSALEAVLVEL